MIDAAEFQKITHVSRETIARLALYESLLIKWQKTINLVGPKTLKDIWGRHFLDSAQLFGLLPKHTRILVDLGSGAGFPGLVLSILGVPEVHLIESDARKAAFLHEAARITESSAIIHNKRIEAVSDLRADVVTARALAPLQDLLNWAFPFLDKPGEEHGVALFLKGQNVEEELTNTTNYWKMQAERFESLTDPTGSILRLNGLSRV